MTTVIKWIMCRVGIHKYRPEPDMPLETCRHCGAWRTSE